MSVLTSEVMRAAAHNGHLYIEFGDDVADKILESAWEWAHRTSASLASRLAVTFEAEERVPEPDGIPFYRVLLEGGGFLYFGGDVRRQGSPVPKIAWTVYPGPSGVQTKGSWRGDSHLANPSQNDALAALVSAIKDAGGLA